MMRSSHAEGGHLSRAMLLLDLASDMSTSYAGLSLEDIMRRAECSRRTAERLRDGLLLLYPEIEEAVEDAGLKRWRLPKITQLLLPDIRSDELADLQLAADQAAAKGATHQAQNLKSLMQKLRNAINKSSLLRVETDMEVLLQAEGLASAPRPSERFDADLVAQLRQALLCSRLVEVSYRARIKRTTDTRLLEPLGFLIGARHYLVAREIKPEGRTAARLFALCRIERCQLTKQPFVQDNDFDIRQYAGRSFGVWQGDEPQKIVLKFSQIAAEDAANFNFHHSQTFTTTSDGSLLLTMTCGGFTELCHHLFTWGREVEILQPEVLQDMMAHFVADAAAALPTQKKVQHD
jgi:predicted DNA-binding transcriptional regulator YafY